ncbi:MAG: hypothetical protein ACFUZC_01405 [Chthoniobacteraceae bacterium]
MRSQSGDWERGHPVTSRAINTGAAIAQRRYGFINRPKLWISRFIP